MLIIITFYVDGGFIMKKIIHKFIESNASNGLLLLDMPTGSGKTFSILRYIYNSIVEHKTERKYFFITSLKKNLPETDLRNFFKESGNEALFDEKFLRIYSNSDSVKNGLTDETAKRIPWEIKQWDEYKKLLDYVHSLNTPNQSNAVKSLNKITNDLLRDNIEPSFRKKLQLLLSKTFSNVNERLKAIHTDKNWQWVADLYPAVFTKEKQIIFMSMDKFIVQNSTIVEPSYMIYNSDIIKDAVIFIDEFDATKETILNNIIQNGLRDKIDYIELFKDIYAALQTHDFPAILTQPSKQRTTGEYRNQSLQSIIDAIKEKADDIYKSYSLIFSHKTKNTDKNLSKNFLFQDHKYHSILNGNKSYIITKRDDKQKINYIEYGTSKPERKENNIHIMLGKIRGFITYFNNGIRILAINYRQCKAERRQPTDDEFTMEDALRSILEQFRLSRMDIDYLVSQILTVSRKSRNDVRSSGYDLSFYENGFRYYSFENSNDFDMQSKIMMCSFQNTPERILLHLCEKSKVIGISATATIPTNIGNFDIDYLKLKLGNTFYELDDYDKERLRKNFVESQNKYKGIQVHTKLLGCDSYDPKVWEDLYENDDLAKQTFEKLQREVNESDNKTYNKERILRIALAFKEFLLHDDIQSFLCILTKHPSKSSNTLNSNLLLEIFENLSKRFKYGFLAKDHFVQLKGDEYDNNKEKLINRLKNGEKIFVISTYQTIGAGQNIQYPIPTGKEDSLVCLNRNRRNSEKDFDAIYLEKPTHIIVKLKKELQEEEFAKYLYQIEYLQEACELSQKETMLNIKEAFTCYSTGKASYIKKNTYNKKSVVLASTKLIIQAIGRICRTYMKSKSIYVYADKNIVNFVDTSVLNNRIFNYEFESLMKKVEENCKSAELPTAENAGNLLSVRANKFINNMIRENWTNERIEKWKRLRKLVLKYPTVSETHLNAEDRFIVSNFYVRLPSPSKVLYYNQCDDYNNIEISFVKNSNFPFWVSEESAKLIKIMQIPELKEYFESQGFATKFEPNELIMSPSLFNNIYKGALGEVIGSLLFKQFTNNRVILDEIEEVNLFELFDFRVPNSNIYIDFKNWHESSQFSDNQMVEKIRKKAHICKCKCVIVANIMANTGNIRRRMIDDFELVEIPAMINESKLTYRSDAVEEIRRCVREYSH